MEKSQGRTRPTPVGSTRGQDVGVLVAKVTCIWQGDPSLILSNRLKFIGSNCAGKYVRKRLLELG